MLACRIRKVGPGLCRVGLIVALLGYGQLSAEAPSAEAPFKELKLQLEEALEKNAIEISLRSRIKTIDTSYLEKLVSLKSQFFDQGNLDGVLEVQDEIKRVKNSDGVSTKLSSIQQLATYQKIYANEIKKIESVEFVGVLRYYKVYEDALAEKEEELVRIGFIDKAVTVRKERDRVKKLIRELSRGNVDLATLRPEEVFTRPEQEDVETQTDDKKVTTADEAKQLTEAVNALQALFEKSLAEHRELVASGEGKMFAEYMDRLKVLNFHYQSEGDLDGVLGVRADIKRFEDSGTLLVGTTKLELLADLKNKFSREIKALRSAERERLFSIYRQHLDSLGEIEQSMVKKRLLDEAIAIRKERERIAELMTKRARKDPVLSVSRMDED